MLRTFNLGYALLCWQPFHFFKNLLNQAVSHVLHDDRL
jgi:hypothetical protein